MENLKSNSLKKYELNGVWYRLNPILMTAFTTGLALIPLALKVGDPGNEIQSPMAVVIQGGQLSASILNLVLSLAYKTEKEPVLV